MRGSLDACLARPAWIVAIVLVSLASAGWLFTQVPRELEPKEDRGAFMVFLQAPEGASYEYTSAHMRTLEKEVLFPLREDGHVFQVLSRVPSRLRLEYVP